MEDTFDMEKELAKAPASRSYDDLEDSTRFKLTDLRFGKDYKEEE